MSAANEMMNCEQYRQAVAADPSFDGAAEHVSVCAECRAFRDEMRALDAGIAKALQLELPALTLPELPSIGAQDKVVSIASRRSPPKARWFALAASVMLAAVIGIRMFAVDVDNISLADEVLAHLDHDPAALVASTTPVSDEALIKVVPESVAHMDHDAGLITYAHSCVINGKTVPHLVIQGELRPDHHPVDAGGERLRRRRRLMVTTSTVFCCPSATAASQSSALVTSRWNESKKVF